LVEHATENRSVGGSIPPLGTILLLSACFEGKYAKSAGYPLQMQQLMESNPG
jgi:hypothetical protein